MSGEELLSAAQGLGASAEDLEAIAAAEDKRTTDERMVDALDIMTSEGISVMIKNPAEIQAAQAGITMTGMEGLTTTLPAAASNVATQVAGLGAEAMLLKDAFTGLKNVVTDVLTGGGGVTPGTYYATPAEGGKKMAIGGVVPPGYANDTYPAMLSSGETVTPVGGATPDVAQLASAIVAAINNQTKALTSAGFGEYYNG